MCTECGRTVDVKIGRFASENDAYDTEYSEPEPQNVQSAFDNDTVEEFTEADIEIIDDADGEPILPEEESSETSEEKSEPEKDDDKESEFEEEARKLEEFSEKTRRCFKAWKKQNKALIWKIRGITVGVLALVIVIVMISRLIKVGYDSTDLLEQNYLSVVHQLEEKGFTDIEAVPVEELEVSEIGRENTVKSVKIGSKETFDADKHFMKGTDIKVMYRSLKKINIPISSKRIDDMNYVEVMEKFQKAGFINVSVEPVHDLKLGVIHFDGEVDDVYVNGEKKFSEKDKCRPDVTVIIKYHTF